MVQKEILCNMCGRKLRVEKGVLLEDAFEATKEWGYFSDKDMTRHKFVLCEKCYDNMVKDFKIKPFVEKVTEL